MATIFKTSYKLIIIKKLNLGLPWSLTFIALMTRLRSIIRYLCGYVSFVKIILLWSVYDLYYAKHKIY